MLFVLIKVVLAMCMPHSMFMESCILVFL